MIVNNNVKVIRLWMCVDVIRDGNRRTLFCVRDAVARYVEQMSKMKTWRQPKLHRERQ